MTADDSRQPASRRNFLLLLLAAAIVGVDQLSKYLCDRLLPYGEPQTVFQGFDLLLVYNTGAAFSFLSNSGGWQRWFLTALSLVVSVLIVGWLARLNQRQWLQGLALALILGGAVGNLIDRAMLGHVIDFISVYWGDWRFATFNLADAAISIGAVLLFLDLLFTREDG